jgi:hypothetical protein
METGAYLSLALWYSVNKTSEWGWWAPHGTERAFLQQVSHLTEDSPKMTPLGQTEWLEGGKQEGEGSWFSFRTSVQLRVCNYHLKTIREDPPLVDEATEGQKIRSDLAHQIPGRKPWE